MPQFSIILPVFNAEAFIETTIASVFAQSYKNFELIVIEDGSSDRTLSIIENLVQKHSKIRLIRHSQLGLARARNAGIEISQSPWIAFIDQADFWHPHKLAAQAAILSAHPEMGIVFGDALVWDPNTSPHFPSPEIDPENISGDLSGFIFHRLIETNWIGLSTAVFRRTVFDVVGGFDATMQPVDDWLLTLRASQHFRCIKLKQTLSLKSTGNHPASPPPVQRNLEFEVRQQAIQHFGSIDLTTLVGAQSLQLDQTNIKIDFSTVQRRQYDSLIKHGISMYHAGHYQDARRSMLNALKYKPFAWKAVAYTAAAIYRQVSRKVES